MKSMTSRRAPRLTHVVGLRGARRRPYQQHGISVTEGDESLRDERGGVLILALIYITAISLIVGALANWAMNDLNNTTRFQSASSIDYSATSAAEVAIQSIRYTPLVAQTAVLGNCFDVPAGMNVSGLSNVNGFTVAVWCNTVQNLASAQTRVVTFYACPVSSLNLASPVAAGLVCQAAPLLTAKVAFDDYPPGGSASLTRTCSTWCGQGATTQKWTWGNTPTFTAGSTPNSITITSSAPGSATVAGPVYTPTATATSSDQIVIYSSTTPVCTISGGVVSFVGVGTCTLNFNDAGNVTYAAATQQTQSFSVAAGANTITISSSAPGSPTVNGATYTPTATATSGDVVQVTSATVPICTITGGVVNFVAAGSCTLNFNDPGNVNFPAAPQKQQSMTVTGNASGTYNGGSSGNLTSSNLYYLINGSSTGSSTSTANSFTPGVATTLTGMTFTMNTSSGTDHTATVGIITGGVWSSTALTCTVTGGNGQTVCSITGSVSVPAASSINVKAIGNSNHTGSWAVTYTQP